MYTGMLSGQPILLLTVFISLTAALLVGNVTNAEDNEEPRSVMCDGVHQIENETEQCTFVQGTDACGTDGGYINYAVVLYCKFQGPRLRPLGYVLYVLWFLYLLLATAVTSDRLFQEQSSMRYFLTIQFTNSFAPNLPVIADALHLSENVAGETLLALGNGAPDFFTSLVAALSMKGGDAGILYGTLLGSGTFVTTVIVGTVIIIRPFHTMQRPLLKDIAFYMCSVFCAFATLWDGIIYLWEAVMFLLIYATYLIFVISGPHLNKFLIKWATDRRLKKEAATMQGRVATGAAQRIPTRTECGLPESTQAIMLDNLGFVPDNGQEAIATAVPVTECISPERQAYGADDEEGGTLESAAIHGIFNRERPVVMFASEVPDQQASRRKNVAMFRQHAKSTGQWETRAASGTGANISPRQPPNLPARLLAEGRSQRTSAAWASPRQRRYQSALSPVTIGSRSRRISSRMASESGQDAALPRSARLILRRVSARLNEKPKAVLKNAEEEDGQMYSETGQNDEKATVTAPVAGAITAQSRFESRTQSRLEAFLEDDTDEETEQKEYELAMKKQQGAKGSRTGAIGNTNIAQSETTTEHKKNGGDISAIPVIPVSPTLSSVQQAVISSIPATIKSSFAEAQNRGQQRVLSVDRPVRQLRFADDLPIATVTSPRALHVSITEDNNSTVKRQEEPWSHGDHYNEQRGETSVVGDREATGETATAQVSEEGHNEGDFDLVEDKPYWKWFVEGYDPTEDWAEQSWFGKLVQILKAPIIFVMLLTNPVLDEDKPMYNWNRPVNCLHCVISPVFVLLAIIEFEVMLDGKFPLIVLFAIIGLVCGIVVFFSSTNVKRPKFHLAFAVLGFVTTVIWIYVLANEVVNLLKCFGLALNISDSILGLTCLAWGNSLGDLINNIIISKQGYSKMAISACFGGMLFNLLLGLGVPLLIVTAKNGGLVYIVQSNVLTILFGFMALELVSSFVAIPLIQHFYVRRPYAVYLFSLYACCIICAVLTEAGIISPNIFSFAYHRSA